MNDYENRFVEWSKNEACKLKEKRFDDLDLDKLIDEVESLGILYTVDLKVKLIQIIYFKLSNQIFKKVDDHYPEQKETELTIHVYCFLEKQHDLIKEFKEEIDEIYNNGLDWFCRDKNIPKKLFSEKCPWSLSDILGLDI